MGEIRAIRHKRIWRHKRAKRGIARKRVSSWMTKDRGRKGKTPKHRRWSRKAPISPSHKIHGYSIKDPSKKRRRILGGEVNERTGYGAARYKSIGKRKEGALSTTRTLQRIINVNPSKQSDKIMRSDIKYLKKKYKL